MSGRKLPGVATPTQATTAIGKYRGELHTNPEPNPPRVFNIFSGSGVLQSGPKSSESESSSPKRSGFFGGSPDYVQPEQPAIPDLSTTVYWSAWSPTSRGASSSKHHLENNQKERGDLAYRQARRKKAREASRPFHQFNYELLRERDRLLRDSNIDSDFAPPDINTQAYHRVKDEWIERGVWNERWGDLPGNCWLHEKEVDSDSEDEDVKSEVNTLAQWSPRPTINDEKDEGIEDGEERRELFAGISNAQPTQVTESFQPKTKKRPGQPDDAHPEPLHERKRLNTTGKTRTRPSSPSVSGQGEDLGLLEGLGKCGGLDESKAETLREIGRMCKQIEDKITELEEDRDASTLVSKPKFLGCIADENVFQRVRELPCKALIRGRTGREIDHVERE